MPREYPQNPQTTGEYIRKYRMDKGLFAKDLAKIIGVTEQTILNWEAERIKNMRNIYTVRLSCLFPELKHLDLL